MARKSRSWRALVDRFDPEVGALTFYVVDLDLSGSDNVIIVSDHGFKADQEGANVWITAFEDQQDPLRSRVPPMESMRSFRARDLAPAD